MSGAALIWEGIFTNGTNEAHLRFILDHLYDLFQFLYDVGRPGSVISESQATDGAVKNGADWFPVSDNPFNELDLRLAANRYAIINQVQRVTLILVNILKIRRTRVPPRGLGDLRMNISLHSDDSNPPPPTYLSELEGGQAALPNEMWLFINSIANECV